MAPLEKIGEVAVFREFQMDSDGQNSLVEWRIPELSNQSTLVYYRSDSFSFSGERWHLILCTGGESVVDSDLIEMFLAKEASPSECPVRWKVGLKKADGVVVNGRELSHTFTAGEDNCGWYFLTRSEFEHHRSKLAPTGDVPTITCSLRNGEPDSVPRPFITIKSLRSDWPTSPCDPDRP